ncbi:iron ABC transporter substrate-binding protein [Acetohalobium arabaticum]|uniref:Periplasmic binding protein n=1 Tax=Acetohalobium arabaticum (strain ATCC 49924 / DSM 5501 / Z-7288) TaxID=574087 RepID=D9QVR1_ACEAZ|nr:iron ABC transporter substrate-binding protein [Acetohalobium arabaticum]ADL12320.1 periplasmic binding protein [Acetohalobium arabaticum DSM 5501]
MKNKKWSILLLIFIFLVFSVITGCTKQTANETKEATEVVTDLNDRKVEVPQNVERIVCIGPGALRLITYMNSTDLVVGVEEGEHKDDWGGAYNLAHPEFKDLPIIGPNHGGDAELIAAQNPDVIFLYGDSNKAKNLQQKTGVPVVMLDYTDLGPNRNQGLYKSWRLIGKVLDKEAKAEELIAYTEELIADLKKRTEDIPKKEKPKVYAGAISYHGGHGIISTKVPFPPFTFLNASYVADELGYEEVQSLMINQEKILDWDPEIIFIDESNLNLVKQDLRKNQEYKSITAIEKGNIYGFLPYASYHRNPATILANTYYMGKVLYPEEFSDIEPDKKANTIFKKFVGKAVYEELAQTYGGFKPIKLKN